MKLLRGIVFLSLSAALLPACDKVQQCNKLVNTINGHTPKLAAATEKFGEIEKNPAVIDEYEAIVEAAMKDINALEFGDEKVSAFAKRYEALLAEAKAIGPTMKEARSDPSKLTAFVAKADETRKTEATLIEEVNTYCGGE